MKNGILFYIMLVFLLIACNKEDNFDIKNYEGEYPVNMDGSQIKTYTPEIKGGELAIKFNGHDWNHAPYLAIFAGKRLLYDNNVSKRFLELGIITSLSNNQIDNCVFESFSIRLPFEIGKKKLSKELFDITNHYIEFRSVNCDAIKDQYNLDVSKNSWFNINSYDEDTKILNIDFDINFIIYVRNSDFGPVYPKYVNIKGTSNVVVNSI